MTFFSLFLMNNSEMSRLLASKFHKLGGEYIEYYDVLFLFNSFHNFVEFQLKEEIQIFPTYTAEIPQIIESFSRCSCGANKEFIGNCQACGVVLCVSCKNPMLNIPVCQAFFCSNIEYGYTDTEDEISNSSTNSEEIMPTPIDYLN